MQSKHLFDGNDQRTQCDVQLHITSKDIVHHDFFIAAGDYSAELATVADAIFREVAFPGGLCLGPRGKPDMSMSSSSKDAPGSEWLAEKHVRFTVQKGINSQLFRAKTRCVVLDYLTLCSFFTSYELYKTSRDWLLL